MEFRTQHAAVLLQAHAPNMRAYLCREIGLEPSAESVAAVDEAYAELVELGYVEQTPEQTLMVYSGGVPKHPFRLTAAGQQAKAVPGTLAEPN
jgi:hypothetical protein